MLKIMTMSVALSVLLHIPVFADSVYVWTDEKGVKHYSNTGPSELSEDYKKGTELPRDPAETAAKKPRPSNTPPPAAPPTDSPPAPAPKAEDSADTEAEFLESTRLNLDNFPQEQGTLVQREKSIVESLQQELEQPGVKREDVIARERKRLTFAVYTLEQAPLEKFGSQNNKRRQVGYYKYRIDELNNNPDAYFQYPQSDAD